jgi:hypothetical protein
MDSMSAAKLIIDHTSGALPRQPDSLAGTSVKEHRDLSAKFSVADTGISVAGAGEAWEVAYQAVRETPNQFFEPDFPSGFYATTGEPGDGTGLALGPDVPHPQDQDPGDRIKGPSFGWHRRDEYTDLARHAVRRSKARQTMFA